MKFLYLIIILSAFSFAEAQIKPNSDKIQKINFIVESVTAYSLDNDTLKHLYTYNDNDLLTEWLVMKRSGGVWDNSFRRQFSYDSDDNLLSETMEDYIGDKWVVNEINTFDLNESGKSLLDLYERYQDGILIWSVRETNVYDSNNSITSKVVEEWLDSLDEYVNSGRYSYSYDAAGNLMTDFGEIWENGAWHNDYRIVYSYDAEGNKLSDLYEIWQDAEWNLISRNLWTYDLNKNILSSIYELWSEDKWEKSLGSSYVYDENNNIAILTNEYYQEGKLDVAEKFTRTFDNKGNILTQMEEGYFGSNWANVSFIEKTYNQNGDEITYTAQRWKSGKWVNYIRFEFEYDKFGKESYTLEQKWTSDSWVNSKRYISEYSSEGFCLSGTNQRWLNNEWSNENRLLFTNDAYGNKTSISNQDWIDNQWNLANATIYIDNFYNEPYSFDTYRIDVNYKQAATPVEETYRPNSTLAVFPNPARDLISIRYSLEIPSQVTLNIIGIDGALIANLKNNQFQPNGEHAINYNTASIPQGVYFIQISSGSFSELRKLIIKR